MLGSLILLSGASLPAAGRDPARSVVRIVNHYQRADWATPWGSARPGESSGSGFVIEGGRVMTNAHVVSDSRLLLLYVAGDPRPHEAQVMQVGHDCDLALIRPLEPDVLKGVPALPFGGLPGLGSSVDTLGFPAGGVRVSSTRGVVSRIEGQLYVHSGVDSHLAVQTDAAINPGSSGGPVVQSGRVVGVAFQNNPSLENVGFFIPMEVISRFLQDAGDGRYDGYPDLGAETGNMENPSARALAGMREGESGARVTRIDPGASADGILEKGDVILAVNGRPVANDGSVEDDGDRIPFGYLIDRLFIGDTVTLDLLRRGERKRLPVPLREHPLSRSRRHVYDEQPRYFVYAGLVFVPLSPGTMQTYGSDWARVAPRTLLDEYFFRVLARAGPRPGERVVLLRRLDDAVNIEMAWFLDQVVERVNGRAIDGLASLIEAFEQNREDHHVIEFAHAGRFTVLDRRRADAANGGILQRYGIHKDRRP
ncbi:MAG TPA: trypsin-like peptidase domain-containing protein [Candidatus Polarisedimenticolia bacterium]|nr:trypsin-like peptidase domain-containing protein [Candidatus Polarisedimenticolia bacterium]